MEPLLIIAACCTRASLQGTLLWRDEYFDVAEKIIKNRDVVYVAARGSGVVVFNVSNDEEDPRVVGTAASGGAYDLKIVDSLLYVANGDMGLAIYNIDDPSEPVLVGTYHCESYCVCEDVDVVGSHVYLVDSSSDVEYNMYVIDTVNPASPVLLSNFTSSGVAYDIDISGAFAYIAHSNGLDVVHVIDPTNPVISGTYLGPTSHSCLILGTTAYIGTESPAGLRTIDLTNPSNPTHIATVSTEDTPYDLDMQEATIYAATGHAGLCIIDVTNRSAPIVQNTIETPNNCRAQGVSHSHTNVVLTCAEEAVFNYNATSHIAADVVGQYGAHGGAVGVHVDGGVAVLADPERNEIRVYDASEVAQPVLLSVLELSDGPVAPFVVGSIVYVGTQGRLCVVDVADPTTPKVLTSIAMSNIESLWVEGHTAYIAAGVGLRIVNVTNPVSPMVVGGYNTTSARGVEVVGSTAYVVSDDGMVVVDVAVPGGVSFVASLALPGGNLLSLSVASPVVYVVDSDGLQVVDVSDPTAPFLAATHALTSARAVRVADTTAYVADKTFGLRIFDVTNPSNPLLVDTVPADGGEHGVHIVSNDTVYVASCGLKVVGVAADTMSPPVTTATPSTAVPMVRTPKPSVLPSPIPTSVSGTPLPPPPPVVQTNPPMPGECDLNPCNGQSCADSSGVAVVGDFVCTCLATWETKVGGPVEACPEMGSRAPPDGGSDSVPYWMWVLVVVGVLMAAGVAVVAALFFAAKKKRGAVSFQNFDGGEEDLMSSQMVDTSARF